MDDDDEMVMIIVGDAENENYQDTKEKVLHESELDLNAILETVETYGEYIGTLDEDLLSEYLDPDIDTEEILPQPIHKIKHEMPSNSHDGYDDYDNVDAVNESDNDEANLLSKDTKKQVSYVAQLLRNFPKMRKDEENIVSHLSEMMRQIKPPPPPAGFVNNVDGKLVCAYCDEVNLTEPAAKRHFQKKHGPRYLVCYSCGADFKCTTGLYRHEMVCPGEHGRVVLKARGRYLGRKGRRRPFLTANKFDPHNRHTHAPDTHTKYLSICSLCPAQFSNKESLMAHELMHLGLRPHKCDQCPNAYTSPVALKRHMEKHSDIEYTCDTCGRAFKAKNSLAMHMNTHLPQRKYPCNDCERRFAQRMALQHHINRDHLNIPPPFACAACPKRFPRMSNLKAHMKAKHGLTLMTREMFMKALPSMKDIELKQATIVFNDPKTKANSPLGDMKMEDPTADEETKEILGTIDDQDQTQETKYTELQEESKDNENIVVEVRNIPSDAIVRTSLEENVELEFFKLVEEGESYSSEITSGSTSDNVNLQPFNLSKRYLRIVDENTPNLNTRKQSECTNTDSVMSEINEVNTKCVKNTVRKINGGPKRPNIIRRSIQTRSGVMKTRRGTSINGNLIDKRVKIT